MKKVFLWLMVLAVISVFLVGCSTGEAVNKNKVNTKGITVNKQGQCNSIIAQANADLVKLFSPL